VHEVFDYILLPARVIKSAAPMNIQQPDDQTRPSVPISPTASLMLGYVIGRLQSIIVREEFVRIISILQRIQPRQLPLRVPSQRSLVAVPVVDVDLDVLGAGAARWDEETPRFAANVRSGRGEVAGFLEADIKETSVRGAGH